MRPRQTKTTLLASVTIYIASLNTANSTKLCIKSISKFTDYKNVKIVVGDCGSTDSTLPRLIKMFKQGLIQEIQLQPLGRTHGEWLDYWTAQCETDYAVFMDSDIEILQSGWLEELLEIAEINSASVVTTEILNQVPSSGFFPPGVFLQSAPRPAPWLILVNPKKCQNMGSWKTIQVKDASISEGGWNCDTGAMVYRNMVAASANICITPNSFLSVFRHHGAMSWTKQLGAQDFLMFWKRRHVIAIYFKVQFRKMVVIKRLFLLRK